MRITVLGKSPAWQDAGGACTGYLIEQDETTLLLDCGSGVFGKLRERVDYGAVDAVVLTHLHADHILDVVTFASALRFGPSAHADTTPRRRPALHGPAGTRDAFGLITQGSGMGPDHVPDAFELFEYAPDDVLEVGPLRIAFSPVEHFIPACAVEVRAPSGARMTFSADTGPCDALVDFAAGTDLLLIEAAVDVPESTGPRGHLTPAEAGEHAARAHARRVVLTHYSDERAAAFARSEAARGFGAPVELAEAGAVYEL